MAKKKNYNNKETAEQKNQTGKKDNGQKNGSNKGRKSGGNNGDKASSPAKGNPVTTSSALLQAAANISFPTTTGYPINVLADTGDVTVRGDTSLRVPGIIRFGYVPTFGTLNRWTDPFNAWVRDVYSFIRHQNSGHANYDAASLGEYLLLYRSALDYLYWMERLYGVTMGSCVPQNAYTPAAIVNECGGDYHDVLANLARLRFYIVAYASRLFQLRVPNLKFFQDGARLLSNVYADCELAKASFYVFDPDGFWVQHIGTTAEDTYLQVKTKPDSMTVEEIVNYGEEILNSLLNSEDFNVMSGDIMKAYSDFASVPVIDEGFTVSPMYDASFLWAIHNAGWVRNSPADAKDDLAKWRIKQNVNPGSNAGCLQFIGKFALREDNTEPFSVMELGQMWFRTQNIPIDLPSDQPTAGEVGFVTRFMLSLEMDSDSEPEVPVFSIASCQSEVITSATMIANPDSPAHSQLIPDNYSVLHKFDQHPMVPDVIGQFNHATGDMEINISSGVLFGDVTNCTVMTKAVKKNIDMAVMLDIFSDGR